MATIRLSLSPENNVVLTPLEDVSAELWATATAWWQPESTSRAPLKTIEVSINTFLSRRQWLRENWTQLGYSVEKPPTDLIETLADHTRMVQLFDDLATTTTLGPEIDLSYLPFKRRLTTFQIENVRNLIRMPNGANFSVPGAGKTTTTLALWLYLRSQNLVDQLLVICPRSAFEAWHEEPRASISTEVRTQKFSDEPIEPSTKLLYVNFEQLESASRLDRLARWMKNSPTHLVIDEAHRVKGGGASKRWQACLQLSYRAKRVDLLTGTPMPQGLDDLRNLFNLSWPDIPRDHFSDSKLRSLARGGVFVRTTKEELGLPGMEIHDIKLPMGEIQREVYAALRSMFKGQFNLSQTDAGYFEQRGKAVMTLLAAATNSGLLARYEGDEPYLGFTWPPVGLLGNERLRSVLSRYSKHEIPEKFQWVARFVAKAKQDGRKVLIWSNFVGNLLALQRILAPFNPAVIYGATSAEDRKVQLDRFRNANNCWILLSNPQTLGEGVSLHHVCHDAIYVDRTYNAGLYLQSLDRIHRLGLPVDQETNVYVLQSDGSIDVPVAHRLRTKIERLGKFLNDTGLVKTTYASDAEDPLDFPHPIDITDFDSLFTHLSDETV